MKNLFFCIFVLFLVSCAGTPSPSPAEPPIIPEAVPIIPEIAAPEMAVPEIAVPETTGEIAAETVMQEPEYTPPPRRTVPPEYIMGRGAATRNQLIAFLMENNDKVDFHFARVLSAYYIEEAALEGVNHDVAFAQMCLETGFLRFGNLVVPEQNNFCGLGATGLPGPDGLPEKGLYFPTPRTGVRAHIQHLKAYGSTEPLNLELVNPRFRLVTRGRAPSIHGLAGTWAADLSYSEKITRILHRLYAESGI